MLKMEKNANKHLWLCQCNNKKLLAAWYYRLGGAVWVGAMEVAVLAVKAP